VYDLALVVALATLAACGSGANGPGVTRLGSRDTLLVSAVNPASGATNVSPSAPITVTFNHGMMTGMEMRVVVHEGAVTRPAAAGTSAWSSDRRVLTFTPARPLASKTTYVLHLSPDLADSTGDTVNFAACAHALGGNPVPASMMGGSYGMMGGSYGMMGGSNGMMGSG
jgi:hypothetical protein